MSKYFVHENSRVVVDALHLILSLDFDPSFSRCSSVFSCSV